MPNDIFYKPNSQFLVNIFLRSLESSSSHQISINNESLGELRYDNMPRYKVVVVISADGRPRYCDRILCKHT